MTAETTHSTSTPPVTGPLTPEQVARYHRDGFLKIQGLYRPDTMLAWKSAMQDHLANAWDVVSGSGVHVWMSDQLPEPLRTAMTDDVVPPVLRQLVGPELEFLSAKAVYKNGVTRFESPWHQDWFYWFGPEKTSIWIALDDATPENGCLKLIPGSHKMTFENRQHAGEAFANRLDPADLDGLPVVDGDANRGDAIFFSDRTVHSSYPNTSGADRWSLISTYRDATVPDESTVWKTSLRV